MKILQINKFYYQKGGSESHFIGLVNLLRKNNHQVIVFSTKNKNNKKALKSDYFIKEIKMHLGNFLNGINLFYNRQAIKVLKEIILKEQPDVAHLHNISHHFSPSIIKLLKKNNIPVIITVHDYKIICPNYKLFNRGEICTKCRGRNFKQCAMNKCVKNSFLASLVMTLEAYWARWKKYYGLVDVFIAPSHFMKNILISNGISSRKIVYLPNFLDYEDSEINPENKKDDNYILFFGRLSEEKGLDFLLKSFKIVKNSKIKLKIVGTGDIESELRRTIEELDLEERVELLGYKSGIELKTIIRSAKFIVLPSVWYENAPYVILESYGLKKAVLGTKMGGIKELIKENETGLTFEAGNKEDFSDKIDYLLKDSNKSDNFGQNGYLFLKNNFGQDNYLKNLLKIYQAEIKNKKC